MRASKLHLPIGILIALHLVTGCCPLYGAGDPSHIVVGGEPGMKIIYKTTNQFVIYLDEPWTVGPGLIGGYGERHIDILFDRNYGLKEKIRTRSWDDIPQQLYVFDEHTAFTCEGGQLVFRS